MQLSFISLIRTTVGKQDRRVCWVSGTSSASALSLLDRAVAHWHRRLYMRPFMVWGMGLRRGQTKLKKVVLDAPHNEQNSITASVGHSFDTQRHRLGQVPHGKRHCSRSSRQSAFRCGGCGSDGCVGDSQRERLESCFHIQRGIYCRGVVLDVEFI